MTPTPSLYEPEWDDEADAWFHRSVTRFLQQHLDDYHNCGSQDDPALVAAVADALVARRDEFVRWIDAPWYDPEVGPVGRWVIDYKALDRASLWDTADECKRHLQLDREAEVCPTLDAWLAALGRGELGEGPWEPRAIDLLTPPAAAAHRQARRRQHRRWPRLCRECGQEFRPGEGGPQQRRSNATRCPDCRKGTQRGTAQRENRR